MRAKAEDGTVEIDSNIVEPSIRPIALNRKNVLFAGHDEGGRNWGRIASLVETCKLNNVEPYIYLKATLEATASEHPAAHIDELMCVTLTKVADTSSILPSPRMSGMMGRTAAMLRKRQCPLWAVLAFVSTKD
jgi:hypothetical protein